jgi:hypothetical protein
MHDIASHQGSFNFESDLPITCWLPDETLFSVAGRHHILSGNYHASQTFLQLFGHPRFRSNHDLPSRVDVFVEKTRGVFGDARQVILGHTLLPFYLPLKSPEHLDVALRAMRGNRAGSLKYQLGMLANHFEAHHPLRACVTCMDEDVSGFHVAYWHRTHQYPLVWVCPRHGTVLLQSTARQSGTHRYDWHLPQRSLLGPPVTSSSALMASGRGLLARLAFAAIGMAELATTVCLDRQRITQIYRKRLSDLGLKDAFGKLDLGRCVASILEMAAPLREIYELFPLPSSPDTARAYVCRLCWLPAGNLHPILHLFAIVWLFDTWQKFLAAYWLETSNCNQSDIASSDVSRDKQLQNIRKAYREEFE